MKYFVGAFLFLLSTLSYSQSIHGVNIKEVYISMPDGIKLAADLYIPENFNPTTKYPILLEYLPYRKNEGRRNRFGLFSYFVKHGYIVARVDIRGTGNSEGKLIEYEYTEQEQQDGEYVINWLSKQSYSNGNIGMMGISWGGFNSIHMAMRKPPALKAIIALMATDDIYEDDVHYIDGMMHIDAYEIGQDLANAIPGAPDFKIDDNYFKNRFDTKPWLLTYKEQPIDGPFWNRASLNSNYKSLTVPSFLIGGLYDGYRDSPTKMLQHVNAPIKAMIGPWNHTFPNWAEPPPTMEWRHEAVRWFDYWLKGIDTGIMDEPRFAVFMRSWHPPGTAPDSIPGNWKWIDNWPTSYTTNDTLFLTEKHSLSKILEKNQSHLLEYHPSIGIEASGSVMWWGDWAPDQQAVDDMSLVYETKPLENDIEILGFPLTNLSVSTDQKLANWIIRISDVSPSGSVTQVTGAGFNGAHRNSSEQPEYIKPNDTLNLKVELHFTTWKFLKGHKIRIAINNAQWPMIWPTPFNMTTTLYTGNKSFLALPVVNKEIKKTPTYKAVDDSTPLPGYSSLASETNSGFAEVAGVTRDTINHIVQVIATNSGADQFPWGIIRYDEIIIHSINEKNPAIASVSSTYKNTVELSERTLVWEGILDFKSTDKYFLYAYTRNLFENNQLIRTKTWKKKIKRRYH